MIFFETHADSLMHRVLKWYWVKWFWVAKQVGNKLKLKKNETLNQYILCEVISYSLDMYSGMTLYSVAQVYNGLSLPLPR